MKYLVPLLSLLLWCAAPAWAGEKQNHARVRQVALSFAQEQTSSLPGKVSIEIKDIDPRVVLPGCAALEAFLPSGSTLLGKTSIGVRCTAPNWTIFLQASIRVSTDVLVANRPLAQNSILSTEDFSPRNGELGRTGILTDPAQAIGKTLKYSIGAGQVLRQDMLRSPDVVKQGQTAEVRVNGNGFVLRSSGQALNSGAAGQNVQVRMPSGQVVNGTTDESGNVVIPP